MRIELKIELDYDDEIMHGDDKESKDWFYDNVLKGDNLLLLDTGDIGDEIGKVKVLALLGGGD